MNATAVKFNADGSAVEYAIEFGGSGSDWGWGVAIDADGNGYVAGSTDSTNFPATPGALDATYNGNGDGFLAKITTGGVIAYATYLGGSGGDGIWDVTVDGGGNAYISGATSSTDFPTTPFAFDTTYNGGDSDVFMAKVNPSGSAVVYSSYLGGIGLEDGFGIAVDASGSAYVAGRTTSTNFPTTPGAFKRRNRGSSDAFVSKFAEV